MTSARGFTLLELLLATVLSVMLMLGVLAVVTDLTTDPRTVGSQDANSELLQTRTIDAWVRVLRGDLSHAIQIDASQPGRVVMLGSGALDDRGRDRTHRPVQVVYSLETVGGRRWLVRRQALQDVLTAHNIQRDLVCSGVRRFELVPQGAESATRQGGSQSGSGGVLGQGQASPDQGPDADENPRPDPDQPDAPEDADTTAGGHSDFGPEESKDLVFGRAGGFDTVYDRSSGKTSLYVNGLWFYPEYAPKWARKKYYEAVGKNDPATESSAGSDASDSGTGTVAGGEAGEDGPSVSSVGTTWRLRVWTDDAEEPTHDRIVTVQLTGGG
jgi:hypothetical protein